MDLDEGVGLQEEVNVAAQFSPGEADIGLLYFSLLMLNFWVFNYVTISISRNQWIEIGIIGRKKCKFCQTYVPWLPIKGKAIFESFRTRKDSTVFGYSDGKCTAM